MRLVTVRGAVGVEAATRATKAAPETAGSAGEPAAAPGGLAMGATEPSNPLAARDAVITGSRYVANTDGFTVTSTAVAAEAVAGSCSGWSGGCGASGCCTGGGCTSGSCGTSASTEIPINSKVISDVPSPSEEAAPQAAPSDRSASIQQSAFRLASTVRRDGTVCIRERRGSDSVRAACARHSAISRLRPTRLRTEQCPVSLLPCSDDV